MSNSNGRVIALSIVYIVAMLAWAVFGYTVLIAAFLALSGTLQVCMGLYILGTVLFFIGTLYFKSVTKR